MSSTEVGALIKKLREENGFTMKELADKVGISESMISYYESGKRSPKLGTLELIAEVFGTTAQEMLFPQNNNNNEDEELVLKDVYFSFAEDARKQGIDPEDIKTALEMIKKLRGGTE